MGLPSVIMKANLTTKEISVWKDDVKIKSFNSIKQAKAFKTEVEVGSKSKIGNAS